MSLSLSLSQWSLHPSRSPRYRGAETPKGEETYRIATHSSILCFNILHIFSMPRRGAFISAFKPFSSYFIHHPHFSGAVGNVFSFFCVFSHNSLSFSPLSSCLISHTYRKQTLKGDSNKLNVPRRDPSRRQSSCYRSPPRPNKKYNVQIFGNFQTVIWQMQGK